MVRLALVTPSDPEHEAMQARRDSHVFQTKERMPFLLHTQDGYPA